MASLDQSDLLLEQLHYLKLSFFLDNHKTLAQQAANEQWDPLKFLSPFLVKDYQLLCPRSHQSLPQLRRE